jgi:phage tail-like protein
MIIDSKQYIPEVYRKEREMQVFTTLIDLILTVCRHDIDNLSCLYDATICPEQFLPKLGDTLNYKYDDANTVTSNRKILEIFPVMMRYKGSETGLLMATALCLTALDISKNNLELANVDTDYINALKDLKIRYDYESATITIDYPNIYTQVRYLLDYVRPVGMYLNLRSVVTTKQYVPMAILAQVHTAIHEYTTKTSEVNTAKVNFSYPITDEILDSWKNAFDDFVEQSGNNIINLNN